MKILIVNTYYYPNMVGGTEQSVKLLAEGLANNGYEVYVLSADKDIEKEEIINNVKIFRLNIKNRVKSTLGKGIRKFCELNNIVIENKISKLIDKINPDIIHTNNLFYLSPIIWKIANKKNIKVVHTLRDYWGLCPKTTLLHKKGQICTNKKIVCKMHTINYNQFSKYVNIVTSPSDFTMNLYKENGLFTDCKSIVVKNAIDINVEESNLLIHEKALRRNKTVKFLFMGTLNSHKGIEFLINTFKKIKSENIELKICGDGPLRGFVEESCKSDDRIEYLGSIFGKEKEKILYESDVMIVPSIWYEPFGRVVIEAYKYGMPVIACTIGGINELLNDEISIGIKENDNKALVDAIIKLSNRENVKKYMINTNKYINGYDIKDQIESFKKVYTL